MPSPGRPLSLAEKRAFQLSTLSLGGAKGREAFGDSIRVERETLRVQNLMHSLSPSISGASLATFPHSAAGIESVKVAAVAPPVARQSQRL